MPRLTEVLEAVAARHPKADFVRIKRAYVFAANMHEGQRRRSGEPYIQHPLAAALTVARLGMDEPSVSAALLHDVVEDTPATLDEVRSRFGDEIAMLVDGVTKVGRIRFRSAEHRQLENYRKMLLATAKDLRVLVIKLADRLHNMRTLGVLPADKRRRIAEETLHLYAPLAHRLGIHWMKQELEDLAFAQLDPDSYQAIAEAIRKRAPRLHAVRERIEKVLAEALARHGLQARIEGRLKHIYGIYEKMQRKRVDFNEIYDLVAFRIIVPEVLDCYRALGIVHGLYRPIPGRFKDYIALPKPNGYQSLHTAVIGPDQHRMEIQIRTEAMHCVAEEGIAAHWAYKEGKGRNDDLRFVWLRRMLDFVQAGEQPEEAIENLRLDLFMQEVFVFSRDGDLFALPRGATVLDFAYAVHTEVGHHAVSARVNGEESSLDRVLRNGDQVEIITSADQTPSRSWLSFVQTPRARYAIRQWFRRHERESAVRLGRRLLREVFQVETLEEAQLQALEAESEEEALAKIGRGEVKLERLSEILGVHARMPFLAREGERFWVRQAECCRPIPGDHAIGVFRAERGMELHRLGCPEVTQAEECIEIRWPEDSAGRYLAEVEIEARNERGVLARISQAIADAGCSIEDLQLRQRAGKIAHMRFLVEVSGRKQLAEVLRALRKLDPVVWVARSFPNKSQARAGGAS